ncbi:MAG: MMPL family transporter [Myxococcales bacterium]|nr:MMPL family transporter [Myxococcales bacterium]
MKRIAVALVRFRYPLLALVIATSAFFGYQATKVQFLHDIDVWFNDGDPKIDNYRWYKKTFPSDQIVLVTFDTDNPFAPSEYRLLRRLTDALAAIEIPRYPPVWGLLTDELERTLTGVKPPSFHPLRSVYSLANVKVATNEWTLIDGDERQPETGAPLFWLGERSEVDDVETVFKVAPFVKTTPRTLEDARYLLRRALETERLRGGLLARDGHHVAVIATLHRDLKSFWSKDKVHDAIHALLATLSRETGRRFYTASMPFLSTEFRSLNRRDQRTLFPMVVALVLVTLAFLFRSFAGVVLPIVVVVVSVVWVRGLMGLLGIDETIIAGILPALLVAVCIADMVHYYSEYRHFALSMDNRQAVVSALTRVMKPCFFTSLTTAFGFGSLLVSDIRVIATFGLLAAFGVTIAFILSTIALPLCVDILRPPKADEHGRARGLGSKMVKLMLRIAEITKRRRAAIAIGSAIVVVVSSFGLARVNIETNDLQLIRRDNPLRASMEVIAKKLAGVAPLVLVFDTHGRDGVKDPRFLRRVERLQQRLRRDPAVRHVTGIVDFVKEFRGIYLGGDERDYRVPDSRAEVSQLLAQLEGDHGEMGDYVDFNYRFTRVVVRTAVLGTKSLRALHDRIAAIGRDVGLVPARGHFTTIPSKPVAARFTVTGLASIFVRMASFLLSSQIKSFSLALLVICLAMMVQLRSVRLGLISMIPNIFPLFVYMGIMGAAGINLDIGTTMIASVAIGISVDDTIHFMERHRIKVAEHGDYEIATRETHKEVGVAITFTSVILVIGFGTLMLGQFVPTTYFGMLTCITMIVALFADLFLLPVVINALKPYRKSVVGAARSAP